MPVKFNNNFFVIGVK